MRPVPAGLAPALATALLGACAQAGARPQAASEEVTPVDVALTPIEDLNLRRDPIPPVLLNARAAPYAAVGTTTCASLGQAIARLDAVLGEDFDTAPPPRQTTSAAEVAQQVVGALIPYRGVIRALSGASAHEWQFQEAIAAGQMRRAYLKGIGQARGCRYPARPAPPRIAPLTLTPPDTLAGG